MYKNLDFIVSPHQLQKEINFLAPAVLRYAVCKQCRIDAYKGKKFYGWNDYAEAWWTPCLTTTPFSIGKTILRPGHICCPPKVFIDMKEEVSSLIAQNFSGDKKKLLLSNLFTIPQQKCYVTDPAPDWCPHQELHEMKKRETIEIFGAATINKEIRFAMCCNCGQEWYIVEKLSESTSLANGIFITTSIPTKKIVTCKKCHQRADITILKRLFFYGE